MSCCHYCCLLLLVVVFLGVVGRASAWRSCSLNLAVGAPCACATTCGSVLIQGEVARTGALAICRRVALGCPPGAQATGAACGGGLCHGVGGGPNGALCVSANADWASNGMPGELFCLLNEPQCCAPDSETTPFQTPPLSQTPTLIPSTTTTTKTTTNMRTTRTINPTTPTVSLLNTNTNNFGMSNNNNIALQMTNDPQSSITTTSTSTSSSSSNSSSSSDDNTSIIVVSSIVGMILLCAILLVVLFFIHRRKEQRTQQEYYHQQQQQPNNIILGTVENNNKNYKKNSSVNNNVHHNYPQEKLHDGSYIVAPEPAMLYSTYNDAPTIAYLHSKSTYNDAPTTAYLQKETHSNNGNNYDKAPPLQYQY